MGRGMAGDGVDRGFGVAGLEGQHFKAVPAYHPLGGGQARLAPVGVDFRVVGAAAHGDGLQRLAHVIGQAGGQQARDQYAAVGVDQRGDGMGQAHTGVAQQAAPVAGMVARGARVDTQIEVHAAARAQEQGGPLGRNAGTVGGQEQIGAQRVAVLLADLAQAGGAHFLAHLHQQLEGIAQPALAHCQHLLQCRQIDAVLALVVGRAAAIPAVTVHHHLPGLQAGAPLGGVAAHHVAMAVAEHGKRRVGLGAFGKQEGRATGHGVGPDLAGKTQ